MNSVERRTKVLGTEDVQAIVEAISAHQLDCKFSGVSPEDLREAVLFYKNFNSIMQDSKKTVLKTLLSIGVTGTIGLVVIGLLAKFKSGQSNF